MKWSKIYHTGLTYKRSDKDVVMSYASDNGYYIKVNREKNRVLGYSVYNQNTFIKSFRTLQEAKDAVEQVSNTGSSKLYDKGYMQNLVNKAKKAYKDKDLKSAGTYWNKIYDACPEPMTRQDYEEHNKYMRQFTNEEVYAITDYLKGRF